MAKTTASLLPTLPRIFFLYVEPFLITYGIILTLSQSTFLTSLPLPTLILPKQSTGYLFNILLYGLIILLSSPPNKRLAQLQILILIIADLTHWGALFATIAQNDPRGWGAVADTKAWTAEVWQLSLYPISTLSIKIATLKGWFGKIRES
ncbi:hypothetical protein B0O99DRAFT_681584 [Bisporella sp. PMI_857]|nr:hypothetical protein B0O99DRAFT_681584 [Bisporella sp. PMI_857]